MAETVYEAAARHRKALARGEQEAVEAIARAYETAWRSVSADLARLTTRIATARANGETVDRGWLEREAAYRTLLLQVERQLAAVVPLLANTSTVVTSAAVAAAQAHATQLLTAIDPALGRINPGAVTQLSGALERGPLYDLLNSKVAGHVDEVADVLRTGIVRGWHPSKTARMVRHTVSTLPTMEARRLVRTEQMRAYREATRQSYLANPVVKSWVWSSRKSIRSCAYCWAMHGTVHQLREVMAAHPNCRCTMLPYVPGVDYGTNGEEAFRALSPAEQREVLGPRAYDEWSAGRIGLQDLVHRSTSPKWGPVGRQGSLTVAKARAAARGGPAPAPSRVTRPRPLA